jgi:Meckel syndrome type 1 protein
MLDVVAAPPPKPAANAAQVSSARSVDAEDTGFQGVLREALDLPAESDRAPAMQAAPKPAEPAAETKPGAQGARVLENMAATETAQMPLPQEAPHTAETGDLASAATAPPALPPINDSLTAAQADQAQMQMALTPPGNALMAPGALPLAGIIAAGQPLADQPGLPLQDAVLGDGAEPVSAAPPMPGSAVAALTQSDKGANKAAVAPPGSQTAVMDAVATNKAAQLLEGSPPATGDATAQIPSALVATDLLIKDQGSPERVLQDTLANALAAGPAQAAAGVAPQKPKAAVGTAKPDPITPAEAALAASRPAEAASRLAQAFSATEAAADMKLVMATETAEASLRLTSLEAPKPTGAKPTGEARAEAVPMAFNGFAATEGMAPRSEAALPSTNLREAPAPMPARQLAPVVVSLALGRGAEALTIALDPVELGRVEVSIGQGKEAGQVRIVAERPETLALLQRDHRELDRALNQSGLGDMARSLSFSLASDQQRQQNQGSGQGQGQRSFMAISGVEADRAMPILPAPLRNPNALLDLAV